MIIQKLPQEIVYNIFTHVCQKDIKNIMYTCKELHHLAKNIYLKDVYWDDGKTQQLRNYLTTESKNERDAQPFNPLPMTKRLIFLNPDLDDYYAFHRYAFHHYNIYNNFSSIQLTEREFIHLLQLFPNLRQLDLEQTPDAMHFMKILNNRQSTELPQFLEEIIMNNDYGLDANMGEDSRLKRFGAYYQFRQSLKSINVAYFEGSFHGRNTIDLLPDFQCLSNLEIYNDINYDVTLLHLLRTCPSLSSVGYTLAFRTPENARQQQESMVRCLDQVKSSISQSFPNLKKMKLAIPKLLVSYSDLLTKYRPTSLDSIEVHLTEKGMHQWIDDVTMQVALDFCESLQKLNSIKLKFNEEASREPQRADTFYAILNALTKEREFKHQSVNQLEAGGMGGVEINVDGSKLSYSYCYYIAFYSGIDENNPTGISYYTPSAYAAEQLAKASEYNVWVDDEDNIPLSVPHYHLDYVKASFRSIKKFQFQCIQRGWLVQAYNLPESDSQSIENMTHLVIDRIIRSQHILDDLITRYFPKIEVLTIGACIVNKLFDDKTTLKLTTCSWLRTLELDITDMGDDPLLIQYTIIDGSQHTGKYLMRVRTKNDNGEEHYFERISSNAMLEELEYVYTISVIGQHQLEKIVLEYNGEVYGTIDL